MALRPAGDELHEDGSVGKEGRAERVRRGRGCRIIS